MMVMHPHKIENIRRNTILMPSEKRQRGVAIITALLIVTLAATISIAISTRLQLDVRRTGNLITTDQAYTYSLLAEKSLQVILQDKDLHDGFVNILIRQGIAKQPLVIDNATIEAEVTDLSACININSLIDNKGAVDAVTEARLTLLLQNKGINNHLTPAIIDWMDPDLTTTTDGAEDGYYLNLEKPYRTAQSPLYSISELRLIRGFEDNEVYSLVNELIQGSYDKATGRFSGPALCAFHIGGPTPININTASIEVLKSLKPNITQPQIEAILQDRTTAALTAVPADFTISANLTTNSSYYLLRTTVKIGNANKVMYSIIYWDGKNTRTISRSQQTL